MAQLRLGYPDFQKRSAEILQVTHSTIDEAERYVRYYPMPFRYLCDPERRVHETYGIPLVVPGVGERVENFAKCSAAVVTDLVLRGQRSFSPRPFVTRYKGDSPQVIYVVDREGIIRRVFRPGPIGAIPSNAQLFRELEALGSS